MLVLATIVEDYGRRFVVKTDDGLLLEANTRKKRTDFACGDRVHIQKINQDQAVIEDYLPRTNVLFRQDVRKSKLLSANVDQVFIIAAPIPAPNHDLIQRAILATVAADIPAVLIVNKNDLLDKNSDVDIWQNYSNLLNIPIMYISALGNIDVVRDKMSGKCNLLIGQSGVGKSTLTNALLGEQIARIGNISAKETGCHTTTHTRLFNIDNCSTLIDSPGIQSFGLYHLKNKELANYFPDMQEFLGKCRFHNCTHRNEPDCAIKIAVEEGKYPMERLLFLQKIYNEINQ
ncbi:MAG: ribosome small subunit-dependent GTPase A [Neisseriaceae bacterium]|nr:ribosome small subunit-dependent GTPase A [Neisseriaceae bacterium]